MKSFSLKQFTILALLFTIAYLIWAFFPFNKPTTLKNPQIIENVSASPSPTVQKPTFLPLDENSDLEKEAKDLTPPSFTQDYKDLTL